MSTRQSLPSSYRDPAGFMIVDDMVFKRVITPVGLDDYQCYTASGLHRELVREGCVLDHREEPAPREEAGWSKVLIPEQLGFISYPYEWSFDELKDAALLTLEIEERALAHGMSLKDASAFNIQFRGARPVFIDTLSFERADGGAWVAYEQFCRQFLGPLLLMLYVSGDANRDLKAELEGFSLERISRALPLRTYWRAGPLLHIHLHRRAATGERAARQAAGSPRLAARKPLVESLRRAVERLRPPAGSREWTGYFEESRFYPRESQLSKFNSVVELARRLNPALVFELGSNTGAYSQALAERGATCIAFDQDGTCINRLYLEERGKSASTVLPLVMDLSNPSPGLGFGLNATLSLFERAQADLVLALALVHHLRVTALLSFRRIAECLARLGRWLLIEYVPADDPAVRLLMGSRSGFEDYQLPVFLASFEGGYWLRDRRQVAGTGRVLYLFERRA
jgi:hypothetical protein